MRPLRSLSSPSSAWRKRSSTPWSKSPSSGRSGSKSASDRFLSRCDHRSDTKEPADDKGLKTDEPPAGETAAVQPKSAEDAEEKKTE